MSLKDTCNHDNSSLLAVASHCVVNMTYISKPGFSKITSSKIPTILIRKKNCHFDEFDEFNEFDE